jgi:hypothetical protein
MHLGELVVVEINRGVHPWLSTCSILAPACIKASAHSGLSEPVLPNFSPVRPPEQPHTALCKAVRPFESLISTYRLLHYNSAFRITILPFHAALLSAARPSRLVEFGLDPS